MSQKPQFPSLGDAGLGFVGKDIPVENLMSVNGVLVVTVSWEAVGDLPSVMGCARLHNRMLLEIWIWCWGLTLCLYSTTAWAGRSG